MELRLTRFVRAVEKITDTHNLDYSNPVLFNMRHPRYFESVSDTPAPQDENAPPIVHEMFRFAAAAEEPWHHNLPINAVWIVTHPHSHYFRQVLKLKSYDSPEESGIFGAIQGEGFNASWVRITRYDEVFNESQVGLSPPGPRGPKGPRGDLGIVHTAGQFNAQRTYEQAEGCMYEGGFWVSRAPNNRGYQPDESPNYWFQLSEPGVDPEVDYERILRAVNEALGWVPGT